MPVIALDIESDPIARPIAAPRPVCTQDSPRAGSCSVRLFSADHVLSLLTSGQTLVLQNGSFDWACMIAEEPGLIPYVFQAYAAGRIECTRINQKLLDIAHGKMSWIKKTRGYALDAIAERYGQTVDKSDPWRLRYGELRDVPVAEWRPEAVHYAEQDALVLHPIWEGQQAQSRAWAEEHGSPILHCAGERAWIDFTLHLAHCYGVRTDPTRVKALQEMTQRRMDRLRKELQNTPLVRPAGTKNKAAAQSLIREAFARQHLPAPLSKTGQDKEAAGEVFDRDKYTSTSRDTCILSGDESLVDYAEYARCAGLVARIADLAQGAEWPLQPRYDSLLETGRTSSSKGLRKKKDRTPTDLLGTQIQNFPRVTHYNVNAGKSLDAQHKSRLVGECFCGGAWPCKSTIPGARECLVPRPGNVFVLADYSSAELHTFAQVCRDLFGFSVMGDLLNAGTDIHLWLGCHAFGTGQALTDLPRGAKDISPFSDWRQTAKPIVFGRLGGMGARKLVLYARTAYGVVLTISEAQRIIDVYQNAAPEIPQYLGYNGALLGDRERGLIKAGRTGFWRGGATYSGMANFSFQHLCAAGALDAWNHVIRECYDPTQESALFGFRPTAFVHDEIVLEGPEARAHAAAMRLQAVMEERFNHYTPDVPTPAEPIVTRVWSKKAKPVREDGLLIPWEMAA